MAHIIETLVRGAASGIGMASEGIHAYKNRKADAPAEQEGEEQAWELDDTQEELIAGDPQAPSGTYAELSPEACEAITKNPGQQVQLFLSRFPLPDPPVRARLPFPVVLPQRRPKDRSRGFVRAYAPVLDDCGIDQVMFLDFIETFDRASQASPWIQTINLATIYTGYIPHGLGILVSAAVKMATNVAIELQARSRTHTFLDEVNEGFFRPRGLYCLVMTWNPDSGNAQASVNVNSQVIASIESVSAQGLAKLQHKFSTSDGQTTGDGELAETAPLIYPALDQLRAHADGETLTKMGKGKAWMNDYMDRRAQAEYAMQNPDGTLAQGPKPVFHSVYSDPAHPASSGNPWSLITAGKWNPPMGIAARMGQGQDGRSGRGLLDRGRGSSDGRLGRAGLLGRGDSGLLGRSGGGLLAGRGTRGLGGRAALVGDRFNSRSAGRVGGSSYNEPVQASRDSSSSGGRGGGVSGLRDGRRGGVRGLQKILKKNVLYLMIVNMPTDDEMAEARQLVDRSMTRSDRHS